MTDAPDELFASASQGDERAVHRLLEQYLPQLRAFVRIHMDDGFRARESSSDVVQSVCRELIATESRFDYRGEPEFRAWLFAAALNKVRHKQRFHMRIKRDIRRDVTPATGAGFDDLGRTYAQCGTPTQELSQRERVEAIERAFDQLPDEYREVIAMARIAKMPHADIAERMGRSVGAVRQLLARALNRLAVALDS